MIRRTVIGASILSVFDFFGGLCFDSTSGSAPHLLPLNGATFACRYPRSWTATRTLQSARTSLAVQSVLEKISHSLLGSLRLKKNVDDLDQLGFRNTQVAKAERNLFDLAGFYRETNADF